MKKYLSFFIFVILIFSSVSLLYSEDSILYILDDAYTVKDVSFDTSLDSFYLVGEIKDSNNSFIIKRILINFGSVPTIG